MPRWLLMWALVGSAATACAGGHDGDVEQPESSSRPTQALAAESSRPSRHTAHGKPAPSSQAASRTRAAAPEAPFDRRFIDPLRAVLATYEVWGRVDDEARWAPWLCRMPRSATARISESGDAQTHGQKLYTLYAMDPQAYGAPGSAMAMTDGTPIEGLRQVIVKEAFAPEPIDAQGHAFHPGGGVGAHGLQPAERDGQRFVAGERRGLYVMMQVEAQDAADTDAGWVYATVDSDMITVTGLGMIESCAGCHREAGDDRLFGLPDSREAQERASAPSNRSTNANANAIRAH